MITVTPQGRICLCKSPLENDYNNQLTFASATAQMNYFNSIIYKTYDNYTYLKKDNVVKVSENIDAIRSCNYLFYQNRGFSNKTYFCFITNMEYVNENCTAITFETDCFQTYQFELTYKPCFVEREHVNNDTIGLHTVHEGLGTGEFMCNQLYDLSPNKEVWTLNHGKKITEDMLIVFQVTDVPTGASAVSNSHIYNRIYSGLTYMAVDSKADANTLISAYAKWGKNDSIVAIFLLPKEFFENASVQTATLTIEGETFTIQNLYTIYDSTYQSELLPVTYYNMNTTINGYSPKNNKLFTREFNYMMVDNNCGGTIEMAYEDFANNRPAFEIMGAVGQSASIKLVPYDYKGYVHAYEFGLTGAKYPICAWKCDYYTNYMTQNGVNIAVNTVNPIIQGFSADMQQASQKQSIVSPINTITAGITSVTNMLATIDKAQKMPDQAKGNINCSDITFSYHKYFSISQMSVRAEVAKIVDDYFSVYGYKVSELKVPNITGRPNWNYVKTIECNVEGDIPQDDLGVIRSMFDKGVTLWHNPATMYNYNVNNKD